MVDAYFEDPNEITINTTGFNSTSTITSTEHGLETVMQLLIMLKK